MKKKILWIVFSVALFSFPKLATAQLNAGCFAPHYSSYTTYNLSADGSSIIQTVQVSGYTQALNPAVWGGPTTGYIYPCQSQTSQMQNATHTATVTNTLGAYGGTYSQGPTSAFAFINYSASVTAPASDGQVLSASTDADITCIVAGLIFNAPSGGYVEVAETLSIYAGPGPDSSH
jgi:hypothetical protein